MPRLFVALDLPASTHGALQALNDEDLSVRWTPPEKYHLTLRFVGDVEEETAQTLQHALGGQGSGTLTLEATGLDVFPSRRRPRVLVVRFREAPALMALQANVDEVVQEAGLEAERRSYSPHVTVGRTKKASTAEVRDYLRARKDFSMDPFSVEAYYLYESELHPGGARHTKRATYRLSPGGGK